MPGALNLDVGGFVMSGGSVSDWVPDTLDDLVSTTEAANRIGVAACTISNWVARGYLYPAGLDQRDHPLYRMIDVLRTARDTRRRAIGESRTA